jgi:ribosome-associated toxin RatA of RatAB toxin-antitoxin module
MHGLGNTSHSAAANIQSEIRTELRPLSIPPNSPSNRPYPPGVSPSAGQPLTRVSLAVWKECVSSLANALKRQFPGSHHEKNWTSVFLEKCRTLLLLISEYQPGENAIWDMSRVTFYDICEMVNKQQTFPALNIVILFRDLFYSMIGAFPREEVGERITPNSAQAYANAVGDVSSFLAGPIFIIIESSETTLAALREANAAPRWRLDTGAAMTSPPIKSPTPKAIDFLPFDGRTPRSPDAQNLDEYVVIEAVSPPPPKAPQNTPSNAALISPYSVSSLEGVNYKIDILFGRLNKIERKGQPFSIEEDLDCDFEYIPLFLGKWKHAIVQGITGERVAARQAFQEGCDVVVVLGRIPLFLEGTLELWYAALQAIFPVNTFPAESSVWGLRGLIKRQAKRHSIIAEQAYVETPPSHLSTSAAALISTPLASRPGEVLSQSPRQINLPSLSPNAAAPSSSGAAAIGAPPVLPLSQRQDLKVQHIQDVAEVLCPAMNVFFVLKMVPVYKEFVPYCEEVTILSSGSSGDNTESDFKMDFSFPAIGKCCIKAKYKYFDASYIFFEMLDGPFQACQGLFSVTPAGAEGKHCRVQLDVYYTLKPAGWSAKQGLMNAALEYGIGKAKKEILPIFTKQAAQLFAKNSLAP